MHVAVDQIAHAATARGHAWTWIRWITTT